LLILGSARRALFAFLLLFFSDALLVCLRVLLLELLQSGCLGLGAPARLLPAPPFLLGLVVDLSGPPLRGERESQRQQHLEGFLVARGAGGDGDVEPTDLVDRVVVDLGKDQLLADAQGVVPAPVAPARAEPAN